MSGGPSAAVVCFRPRSSSGLVALGKALGEALVGAAGSRRTLVLGFDGELGTGKTTLIGGALRALGVETPVTSPTYGLVHPYSVRPAGAEGMIEVLHIDLYRLQHAWELDELGLPEELPGSSAGAGRMLLVEWFANARGRLGVADVAVFLEHSDRGRIVRAQGNSPSGERVVQGLHGASHRDLLWEQDQALL